MDIETTSRLCLCGCGTAIPARDKQGRPHAYAIGHSTKGRSRPLADRLWAKVNRDGPIPEHVPNLGPCWLWIGTRTDDGYGRIHTGDGRRTALTHRVSWELHHGPISDGLLVLHRCDTPACLRPDHLFLGSDLVNSRDSVSKGRHAFGGRKSNAKLTVETARAIRERYALGGISCRALATCFGVSHSTICKVLARRAWLQEGVSA